jgi:hypothetical protein
MTDDPEIDYEALTQDAMRGVMRAVLQRVAASGLPGDHHFYIAFNTRAPGVGLSRRLREKYPDEMTIVLQHRFWDLAVREDKFEVKLTFDGIPELLSIPFSAVKVFFDPSVQYGLQFEETTPAGDPGRRTLGARRIGQPDSSNNESAPGGPSRLPGRAPQIDRRRGPRKPRADRATDAPPDAANQPGPSPGMVSPSPPRATPVPPPTPSMGTPASTVPTIARSEKDKLAPAGQSADTASPETGAATPDGSDEAEAKPESAGAKIVNIESFRKK